ncbi:Membrane-associating domain [Rhizoctonia solani]|uniref:Membrane-associating domain n=1 Tax=Rhizoctonia solani TaxID=456999 RepID=A0A8H7IG47_9AGAM|nr:Membrane-associating domain [Rhizoctonia solani]
MGLSTHVRRGHPSEHLLSHSVYIGVADHGFSHLWAPYILWNYRRLHCNMLTVRYKQHRNWLSISVRDRTHLLLFTSWWTVLLSAAILDNGSAPSYSRLCRNYLGILDSGRRIYNGQHGRRHQLLTRRGTGYLLQPIECVDGVRMVEWVLTTFALFVVIICAVRSARRGDGTRGALVVD